MSHPVLIIWTCKDSSEARRIVSLLLNKHLIACASLIPRVESFFHWEGKIEHTEETKLFLKTMSHQSSAIRELILAHASYEVPEILEISIDEGNPTYLEWLKKVVT